MIDLAWEDGTRTTTVVPLVDPDTGRAYRNDGQVITLTVQWPDHPAIARPRARFLAMLGAFTDALTVTTGATDDDGMPVRAPRPGVSAEDAAEWTVKRDDALRAYAVALVCDWTAPEPCTPEAVERLFARAPFAFALVMEAAGDADRFLPPSQRPSNSASAPSPVAAA